MKIESNETVLIGGWHLQEGHMVADETCNRIHSLIHSHLRELGRDDSGWQCLYLNPDDNRLWELTYPQSELHGGGPPQLRSLTSYEARKKYSTVFPQN